MHFILLRRLPMRSHAYVTDCDSNGQEWTPVGHIMVTGQGGTHPFLIFNLIHISSPHSGGRFWGRENLSGYFRWKNNLFWMFRWPAVRILLFVAKKCIALCWTRRMKGVMKAVCCVFRKTQHRHKPITHQYIACTKPSGVMRGTVMRHGQILGTAWSDEGP